MAFKSIGQRMGFVSIADAERKAKAVGRRKGLEEGRKVGRELGVEEGRKVGVEEGRKVGREEGLKVGILQEQANSEKKMRLFVKRIAKKMNVSEAELLALKP